MTRMVRKTLRQSIYAHIDWVRHCKKSVKFRKKQTLRKRIGKSYLYVTKFDFECRAWNTTPFTGLNFAPYRSHQITL